MAARRTKKKAAKKTARRRTGRLAPSRVARGLSPQAIVLPLSDPALADLVAAVEAAGGAPVGGYRDPLAGRPLLLAALPVKAVQPTPFQRDLSPTHTKRLAEKIAEADAFLDPVIVVQGADGRLWTPNGRHRLAAAKVLGLKLITALVSPDENLAYRILALNTEKAHNLKDRSLEVIRMAQVLAEARPRAKENDFAAEFEAPELLTLGLIYLENKRFAGGAYRPFLKKVDRFQDKTLRASLKQRAGWAARLQAIDDQVREIIARLQKKGFRSPYLRTYVVARINPLRFHRAKRGDDTPPMSMNAALTRMAANARQFDTDAVRPGELALVAAVAGEED